MSHRSTDGFGMVAVIATYVYFLLYAQFGFIHALEGALPGAALVQRAMGCMGGAGIAVSLAVGYFLRFVSARKLLIVGFLGASLTPLVATQAVSPTAFMFVAASVGAFTAMITVALATNLRGFVRGGHFGLKIGAATGIAYLLCNVPRIFEGSATSQGVISAVGCIIGAVAALLLTGKPEAAELERSPVSFADCRTVGFVSVVLSFLALVWLDSAAFATIQQAVDLKGQTWATPEQKLLMGIVHLFAALFAGWLFDRGLFRSVLVAAFGLFACALPNLDQGGLRGPLYAVGISFYSVVLVLYPSARADEPGAVPARWRAAILYGVAGWIGSALGVGMARELHHIPAPFLWSAGGLIVVAGALATPTLRGMRLPLAFGTVSLAMGLGWPDAVPSQESAVERGRRVYIEEGCINCHSQYLRPETTDVVNWGPYREVNFDEEPPMIGNRRQGPDLMNVGNRRSAEWQRLHLQMPATVSPGSKMPSYKHLFADGEARGEDLVAHLMSLGQGSMADHAAFTREWQPAEPILGSVHEGQRLFERSCSPCHGEKGAADGPLRTTLFRPAMDLTKGPFSYVEADTTPEEQTRALARIVKFGLPGTNMAGHEYFTDNEVMNIVAYLQALNTKKK